MKSNALSRFRNSKFALWFGPFIDASLLFLSCLYIFCLPFEEATALFGVSVLRMIGIATIPVIVLSLLFRFELSDIRKCIPFLASLLLVFLFLVSVVYTHDLHLWFSQFISFAMNVFLSFGFFLSILSAKDKGKLFFKGMMISSVVSSVFAVIIEILFNEKSYFFTGRFTIDIFGSNFDQNWLASILFIGLVSCISLFFHRPRKRLAKFLYIFTAIFIVAGIVLTGSRMAYILLAICFLSYFFYLALHSRRPWIVISVFSAFVIMIAAIVPFLPSSILSRLSLANLFNFYEPGGRGEIWVSLFPYLKSKPLLGWGGGSSFYLTTLSSGSPRAIHNSYLQMYLDFGIVGLLLYTAPLIYLLFVAFKKGRIISVITMVCALFISVFLDAAFCKFFWVYYLFAACGICAPVRQGAFRLVHRVKNTRIKI